MIDIACIAYSNYALFDRCIRHNKALSPHFRFLVVDNTPPDRREEGFLDYIRGPQVYTFDRTDEWAFDGESHGHALDYLVAKAQTDIIGTLDHDFFWIRPDIHDWVRELFVMGHKVVGAAGWYPPAQPDWQNVIDARHPNRAGWLAPVVWGQFLDKRVADKETFVCAITEGPYGYETGWRVRQYIIDNGIKNLTIPGFVYPGQPDKMACFFGTEKYPVGLHMLKGINRITSEDFASIQHLTAMASQKWD